MDRVDRNGKTKSKNLDCYWEDDSVKHNAGDQMVIIPGNWQFWCLQVLSLVMSTCLIAAPPALANGDANSRDIYKIECKHASGPETFCVTAPSQSLLYLWGNFEYQGNNLDMRCVQNADLLRAPNPKGVDKTWLCAEYRYYESYESKDAAFRNGFYHVEIFSAGISMTARAEVYRILQANPPLHVLTMTCRVYSEKFPSLESVPSSVAKTSCL